MANNKQALSMLSLAAKAGKVYGGAFLTEKAVTGNKAYLVLIADNASDNTKKKLTDKAAYYHVPVRIVGDSETLGKMIGRQDRVSAAVTDRGFAEQIITKLDCE